MKIHATLTQWLIVPALILTFAQCSSDQKKDIPGTWKVESVEADTDTSRIKPDALERTLDMYREMHFEFSENNSMNIVSSGKPLPGRWKYEKDENAVYIRLDNSSNKNYQKLGVLEDGKIVSTNETGIGLIVITYVMEE
ncbi:MAG: hypothetical protein R6T99_09260 [Bacteroidales bacterium]